MSDLSSLSDSITEPPVKTKAPQQPHSRQTRIPALDGVRGLAIILVMCWHYIRMPLFQNTNPILTGVGQLLGTCWSGVDLFFVLSGFLLGGILYFPRKTGQSSELVIFINDLVFKFHR
jgi:peptidoglycan/LPS O-acetylase OafA/YrhL